MGKLDSDAHAGTNAFDEGDDFLQGQFIGFAIESETAMRNSPPALHCGCLNHDGASPAAGQIRQMLQVPIARASVGGTVLAHRGDGQAILYFNWP